MGNPIYLDRQPRSGAPSSSVRIRPSATFALAFNVAILDEVDVSTQSERAALFFPGD